VELRTYIFERFNLLGSIFHIEKRIFLFFKIEEIFNCNLLWDCSEKENPTFYESKCFVWSKNTIHQISSYRYRSSKGVQIISIFMSRPSRREYPDYYEVIDRPMDMRTVNEKIKWVGHQSKNHPQFWQFVFLFKEQCLQDCCRLHCWFPSDIFELPKVQWGGFRHL